MCGDICWVGQLCSTGERTLPQPHTNRYDHDHHSDEEHYGARWRRGKIQVACGELEALVEAHTNGVRITEGQMWIRRTTVSRISLSQYDLGATKFS
jgi:hypothetical protein